MGFQNLSLINPKGFPDDEAFFRAKGAKDILENVKIYNDLVKPLKDATLIFGTSARTRTITRTIIVICVVSPLLGQTTFAISNLESEISLVAFFPKLVCESTPSDIPRRPKSIKTL